MLPPARVKVKRRRIRHIAACVVGHHRDVITDLVLVRIPLERVEQVAHRHIRCPGDARVSAPGIK